MAISAFWRRKVDLPPMFGPVSSQIAPCLAVFLRRQVAVVGDERASGLTPQRLLDDRMAAAFDLEGEAVVDGRAAMVFALGQPRKRCRHIEHGQRFGAGADRVGAGDDLGHQPVEDGELDASARGRRRWRSWFRARPAPWW